MGVHKNSCYETNIYMYSGTYKLGSQRVMHFQLCMYGTVQNHCYICSPVYNYIST